MNLSDKVKENFYSSVQYFSNFFPIKTTNSLYEIGEHAVGLLTSASVLYGQTAFFGPLTPLASSWLVPKAYCDFQKEYKEDANFVGSMEIAFGAIYNLQLALNGHNPLDFKSLTLNSLSLGVVTMVLHGAILPAIADDIAHCS